MFFLEPSADSHSFFIMHWQKCVVKTHFSPKNNLNSWYWAEYRVTSLSFWRLVCLTLMKWLNSTTMKFSSQPVWVAQGRQTDRVMKTDSVSGRKAQSLWDRQTESNRSWKARAWEWDEQLERYRRWARGTGSVREKVHKERGAKWAVRTPPPFSPSLQDTESYTPPEWSPGHGSWKRHFELIDAFSWDM